MNRIRSFSSWILTAVVTLVAGASIVAFDQAPQLLSIRTANTAHPPSVATTVPSHTARVVSLQTFGANSVREAAEPVVQVEDTTTTVAPSTTTSTTSTTYTTSTTSTTSTTTTTEDTVPATTTSLPLHHDGGSDDGGVSGGSGGTDN